MSNQQVDSQLRAEVVNTLTIMYSSTNNDEIQGSIAHLQQLLGNLNGNAVAALGLDILGDPNVEHPSVRQYGGQMVVRELKEGEFDAGRVPLQVLVGALNFADADGTPRIVSNAISDVLVAAAMYLWPRDWPTFLDQIFREDAHNHPALLRCQQSFVLLCDDLPFSILTKQRISALRRESRECAATIVKRGIAVLFEQYSLGDDANPAEMEIAIQIIATAGKWSKAAALWEVGLHEALVTLTTFPPCAKEAIIAAATVLSSVTLAQEDEVGVSFVCQVLEKTPALVEAQAWDAIDALLELAASVRSEMGSVFDGALHDCCLALLEVPSVFFAGPVCDTLTKVVERSAEHVDAERIIRGSLALCHKHRSHPSRDLSAANELSRLQFPTVEAFDIGFSEMRNGMSSLLKLLAVKVPGVCSQAINFIINNELPEPSSDEDRSQFGHIKQQTFTYTQWEAAYFIIDNMSVALKEPNMELAQSLQNFLQNRQPHDAVLIPPFLNLALAFTSLPNVPMGDLLDTLFSFMQFPGKPEDEDANSGRKRAFTSFISLCSEHGSALYPVLDDIVQEVRRQIASTNARTRDLRNLLFEGLSALSNAMTTDQQQSLLDEFVSPLVSDVQEIGGNIDAEELCNILTIDNPAKKGTRQKLMDSMSVISSLCRRCNKSPYLEDVANAILPAWGAVVVAFHQLPSVLPGDLQGIDTYDDWQLNQARSGGNRPPPGNRDRRARIRGVYNALQHILFSGLGALGRFVDAESYAAGWESIIAGCENASVLTMRALCEHCFFKVGATFPAMIHVLFPAFTRFLTAQATNPARDEGADILNRRNLSYMCRDALAFARDVVLNPGVYRTDPEVCSITFALFKTIFITGYANRDVVPVIVKLVAEAAQSNSGQALAMFGMLAVEYGCNEGFNMQDKRTIAYAMADLYINAFPQYSEALGQIGLPETDVDKLHHALNSSPRIEGKRKAFERTIGDIFAQNTASLGYDATLGGCIM